MTVVDAVKKNKNKKKSPSWPQPYISQLKLGSFPSRQQFHRNVGCMERRGSHNDPPDYTAELGCHQS